MEEVDEGVFLGVEAFFGVFLGVATFFARAAAFFGVPFFGVAFLPAFFPGVDMGVDDDDGTVAAGRDKGSFWA